MTRSFFPIVLTLVAGAGTALVILVLSSLLGGLKRSRTDMTPYECGIRPFESADKRFSVKFYMIAMLFILFDIEAAFLYPWAVSMRSFDRGFVFGEMCVFLAILIVGYVYVWKRGALELD